MWNGVDMGYPLRSQPAGILFHVLNRGNEKRVIFRDESDFLKYVNLMHYYKTKLSIKIYHYVIMPNHVHILIETTRPNSLSRFMQCLTSGYARYYRRRYGGIGHVWQGRYRSIPIEAELYYLQCAQYIEMNPVRANLVKNPIDYHWSSASKQPMPWLDIHPIAIASTHLPIEMVAGIPHVTDFSSSYAYGSPSFLVQLWCQRRL